MLAGVFLPFAVNRSRREDPLKFQGNAKGRRTLISCQASLGPIVRRPLAARRQLAAAAGQQPSAGRVSEAHEKLQRRKIGTSPKFAVKSTRSRPEVAQSWTEVNQSWPAGPKSAPSHPKVSPKQQVGPELAQSQAKVNPKSAPSRPRVGPKLAPNKPQVSPKLAPSRPQVGFKSVRKWPQVGSKSARGRSKVGL